MKRIKSLLILLVLTSVFACKVNAQSYPPSGTNYYHTEGANYKFAIEGSKVTIMYLRADGNVSNSYDYYFDHNEGNDAVYYQDSYDYIYGTHQPNTSSWLKVTLDGSRISSSMGGIYYRGYKNLSRSNSSSNYYSGSSSTNSNSTTTTTTSTRNNRTEKKETMCTLCYGSGKCHNCNGKGYHTNSYDIRKKVSCGNCNGTGRCPFCNGTGKRTH